MTWYIILSVLLLAAISCASWLALRISKTKRAMQKALDEAKKAEQEAVEAAEKAAEERFIRTVDIRYVPQRFEQMAIQAKILIPMDIPEKYVEEELKGKIAEMIPEFWEVSRDIGGPLEQAIQYTAKLYVLKKEEG